GRRLALPAADLPLCRPGRGREEPRRLPVARPAGHQGRGRRRAAAPGVAVRFPRREIRRRAARCAARRRLCRRVRVRLSLGAGHPPPSYPAPHTKSLLRHPRTLALGARALGAYLRFALRSTRWTLHGREQLGPYLYGDPAVFAFWHERLPLMPALWMLALRE